LNEQALGVKLEDIKTILATDCGSTTSKARLFKKLGDEFRYVTSGEAPTTVEAPYEDVTLGVRNAIREIDVKKCNLYDCRYHIYNKILEELEKEKEIYFV